MKREAKMSNEILAPPKDEGYDFTEKELNEILTEEELEHFEEGMKLKNRSRPASEVDFERAAKSIALQMDELLSM
jgi:hypothetical protein